MQTVYVDAETYSEVSVRVKDGGVGTYAHVNHPSTTPILWAVQLEGQEEPAVFEEPNLFELLPPGPVEIVHWGAFDRLLIEAKLLVKKGTTFRDLREESLTYGAPGKLEDAAPFWCGQQKDAAGAKLIKLFSLPDKEGRRHYPDEHPEEWQAFRRYAAQDVAVLPAIDAVIQTARVNGGHDPAIHTPARVMVQRMNDRGVGVDLEMAKVSLDMMEREREQAFARCQELCGLNPTQLQKLGGVLGLPNMQAETVEDFIDSTDDPVKREIAELQQSIAGAAVKKLDVMVRMAEDSRVRGCFQYHGAHTRRLTSLDLQLHNFVRAAYDPKFFTERLEPFMGTSGLLFKAIRKNIRGYLKALSGIFVAADYKAIECRVINWLAGEEWVLDLFRSGGDPYRHNASEVFRLPVAEIDDGRRQVGKIGELALGFAGGVGAVKQSAKSYRLEIDDALAEHMKVTYRRTHPNVVRLWEKCERAFRLAMDGHTVCVNGKITFEHHPWFVKVIRPSGFAQYFWQPRITQGEYGDEITYMGRTRGGQMRWMKTYGGDIAQGVTQGTAADLMLEGMLRVEAEGILPVLSIHDEGVFEVDPDEWDGDLVRHVCDLMEEPPAWADGLPVEAEGWMGPRFTKA